MAFRIKHLDHVVLYVADLDRAVRFYCDVLGCTLERRVATINLVQLRAGASMIDLLPTGPGRAPAAATWTIWPSGSIPSTSRPCAPI
jgi:glyoxylase I family protein